MKITIDTKEDSKEEIHKVINLLSNIVNNEKNEFLSSRKDAFSDNDVFSGLGDSSTSDLNNTNNTGNGDVGGANQNAFVNMFGDNSTQTEKTAEEPVIDLAKLSSLREKQEEVEEEKEDVKVVSY